jgi:glucose-1-phosphate cytidylyltransferase
VSSNRRLKVVILCGGLGTRLREETEHRPKPLVPIGDFPILWHIMKTYGSYGYVDFILALGYKGYLIKDYFLNYDLLNSDFRLSLGTKEVALLEPRHQEHDWTITFVDTGAATMTGGRLKRLAPLLMDDPEFLVTYGDGVTDVDIPAVVEFHRHQGVMATVTGVRPIARFGELMISGERVTGFAEKIVDGDDWINGGYFVMSPAIFDYLDGDETVLEGPPLERMAMEQHLAVYRHDGYWHCMDTQRDMIHLNDQWSSGQAPWKRW